MKVCQHHQLFLCLSLGFGHYFPPKCQEIINAKESALAALKSGPARRQQPSPKEMVEWGGGKVLRQEYAWFWLWRDLVPQLRVWKQSSQSKGRCPEIGSSTGKSMSTPGGKGLCPGNGTPWGPEHFAYLVVFLSFVSSHYLFLTLFHLLLLRYIGLTQITHDNFPISKSLTSSHFQSSFNHVKYIFTGSGNRTWESLSGEYYSAYHN